MFSLFAFGLSFVKTCILPYFLSQYYDDTYPTVKEQKAFEKNIFNKTHRTDSKILSSQKTAFVSAHERQLTSAFANP